MFWFFPPLRFRGEDAKDWAVECGCDEVGTGLCVLTGVGTRVGCNVRVSSTSKVGLKEYELRTFLKEDDEETEKTGA